MVYGIVFIILLLVAGVGELMADFNSVYFILRKLLGVIQSHIPYFAFFVLFYSSL